MLFVTSNERQENKDRHTFSHHKKQSFDLSLIKKHVKQKLLHKRMCFDPILIVNRQSAISRAF